MKYELTGNYPKDKILNEPHLTSVHLNIDKPEFRFPFFFTVKSIDFGKGDFGEYITMWLESEEIKKIANDNSIGVRKTLNINPNAKGFLMREFQILIEMFKIDDSDKLKDGLLNKAIPCVLNRRMGRDKKEIRNKDGYVLIGVKIISPSEYNALDNEKVENIKQNYVEKKKNENELVTQKPLSEYPDEPCNNCKRMTKRENLYHIGDMSLCKECYPVIMERRQKEKEKKDTDENVCPICKKKVQNGMMKAHQDFKCKMFMD